MAAAKFIPQRFQNFILPQHRHAHAALRRTGAIKKPTKAQFLADVRAKTQRKKPGPKKHGPIAKALKARIIMIEQNGAMPSDEWQKAENFMAELFEQDMLNELKHYGNDGLNYQWGQDSITAYCLAYRIALDQGL